MGETPASATSTIIQVKEGYTPAQISSDNPSTPSTTGLSVLPTRTADSPKLKTDAERMKFCVDILKRVDLSAPYTQVLITVMTRDLARSVYALLEPMGQQFPGLTVKLIIPGFKKTETVCASQVVIGTPDMIEKEIYKRNYLVINQLKELVFDEAYDLIKLDVVIGMTPTKKQVLRIQEAAPRTVNVIVATF